MGLEGGLGLGSGFFSFFSFFFLALVLFLSRSKPKVPFLGLSLLRNRTEMLSTHATHDGDLVGNRRQRDFVRSFYSCSHWARCSLVGSSIPAKNQSRSQHSTWECNIWLDKDQHSTLQFNFVVLNVIVKTLDFNFISESSTLNFVPQHSSLLINIALDTCAFRERWTLNHQVNSWITKGEPIPPKLK